MKTRKPLWIFLTLLLCAALLMAASCGEQPKELCQVCGEDPCICALCPICGEDPCVCQPCEDCGQTPCTCPFNFLKGNYSMTYNITEYVDGQKQVSYSITITKNAAGYYFKDVVTEPRIYKKTFGGEYFYELYTYDGLMGAWTPNMFSDMYGGQGALDEDYIEIKASEFLMYAKYCISYESIMEKTGSETIAGRDCDKFTYTVNSVNYTCWLDKANSACLKLVIDGAVAGQSYEFVCTEFKLTKDKVKLPDNS